jgi:hypothetical protein
MYQLLNYLKINPGNNKYDGMYKSVNKNDF